METFDGWGQLTEAGLFDPRLPHRRGAREWMADEWQPQDEECWKCGRLIPAGQRHHAWRVGDEQRRMCLGNCRPHRPPRKVSRLRRWLRAIDWGLLIISALVYLAIIYAFGWIMAGA